MPELPEVEMARRHLEATSLCQTIKAAKVLDERILNSVSSELLELNLDLWLTLHLGLTGRLVYLQSGEEVPGHTRLLITFMGCCRLAFDDLRIFGEVGITCSPQSFLMGRKIGPDALQLDRDGFLKIMRDRNGMIKAMLLNQSLIAGLGNLYADEALFQAGISPRSRHLSEAQLSVLFSSIQETLLASLSAQANLRKLPDSYLLPHRHPGETCPRDGALLRHEKIAGRTSYYCPKHQK